MADQPISSHLRTIFELALQDYEIKTQMSLANHPLVQKLENSHSVESITILLQDQVGAFGEFRGRDRIMKSIRSTVSFLYKLEATAALVDGISLPSLPAKALFTGLGVLLAVAKGVVDSYDALVDFLEAIEHFLKFLDIYTVVPPTSALDELAVKIMAEVLSTLALATKELKQGRSKIFGRDKHTEAVLTRLDRLTLDETQTTAEEILKVVYGLVQDTNGKTSGEAVREAPQILHDMGTDLDKSKRHRLPQDIRNWLSPPDPWKNHNIARDSRHEGTATWFIQGDTFSEWKSSGPSSLLWIHGKPGAGKSVLCSRIIENIDTMRKCGLAFLAFFYHDFREDQKRDLRGLLSAVLFQFCDQSNSYYDILSKFYSTHRYGAQNPSDDALVRCLEDILKVPGQAPIFLIVDALDECSNTSPMPSYREKTLALLEKLIDWQLPNLRICVTSRPEVDIKAILGPLTFRSISLEDERGQMEDIENYIKSVVEKDPRNRRWATQDKEMVIDVLTRNADGMFRWVYCQVLYLRGCHPGRIRHALAELPETLDETYERTLREINKADWELAHRLFQTVAVASRPLRVEELAEFLAFDFNAGPTPKFNEGWRLEDPINAVQSTCPSFLAVVDIGDSQIIQFSHFSVKEFLTSSRLAEAKQEISRYHISTTPAHTLVAKACLGILLHLDENVVKDALQKFPLTPYAALHWVDHARLEDVSRNVEDAINILFDSSKPHLAVWVSLHNTELPSWKLFKRGERPLPPSGTPLHYATICDLHAFVRMLVVENPHDVDSRAFDNLTPLHMASLRGYEQVARVLLESDADVTAQNDDEETPLHMASREGHLQVVRALLKHGASTTARDKAGSTPLHLALQLRDDEDPHVPNSDADTRAEDEDENRLAQLHRGLQMDFLSYLFSQVASDRLERNPLDPRMDTTVQGAILLHEALRHRYTGHLYFHPKPEADAMDRDKSGWNDLASHNGHLAIAQLLVEHGADPTVRNNNGRCALHLASLSEYVEVVQYLVEHGADPTVQDNDGRAPLSFASRDGYVEVAQFLVEHGTDPTVQDKNGRTPLHFASRDGHVEVARFLVEHGTDPTARDKDGRTSLHLASRDGHVEVARLLAEHGADPTAQDKDGRTPLHLASRDGHVEVARFLVEHGTDPTAQDKDEKTPLHFASRDGHVEVARFLVEHGADPTARERDGRTLLHLASQNGHVEIVRLLVEHGTDPMAQDKHGRTPLHFASQSGHVDIVWFLVEHGANPTIELKEPWTPLYFASRNGYVQIVQFLVEPGADPMARNKDGMVFLHSVSGKGRNWRVKRRCYRR